MYKGRKSSRKRFAQIVDHGVWLRLAKMHGVRVALGKDAKAKLDELSSRHPEWQLKPDERDEFPLWVGDRGKPTSFRGRAAPSPVN